jgi:phenylacetate-CoA ligase
MVNAATGFLDEVEELNRLQWANRELIEKRLFTRLKFTIEHAYEHFRFYRARFKSVGMKPSDIKTLEDFRRVPVITKKELSEALESEGTLRRLWGGTLTSTGGTTGTPLAFLISRDAGTAGLVSKIFFDSWIGVGACERKFSSWTKTSFKDRWFLNELEATSVSIIRNPEEVFKKLSRFGPQLIGGNVALRVLASFLVKNGLRLDGEVKGVAAWGIPLVAHHTKIMSEAFCDNIYDRYGSAELSGAVAQQCVEKRGLHVNSDLSLIEVIKDGEPCSNGERGKLVVTNLRNLATPFVRYEQEDTAVRLDDCACGRHLPLIADVEGKDPSFFEMEGGVEIPRATLDSLFPSVRNLPIVYFYRSSPSRDLIFALWKSFGSV